MHVGIDFDNTIVCYDRLFHKVCFEAGLIPQEIPQGKSAVRDYLRQQGREDDWTEIQGVVYGPRIVEANPFDGVQEFIRQALADGHQVSIISHKTKYPYRGEKHDLHAAARSFLSEHGFVCDGMLTEESVHLQPTKEDKARCIAELGCNWFIDDLPEFLEMVTQPSSIQRVLFDPNQVHATDERWRKVEGWNEIQEVIL